jgi:hypothetical protein
MLANIASSIPEMSLFDQNELDTNPVLNAHTVPSTIPAAPTLDTVPLLGALLVADGLITHKQLTACLKLQNQGVPNVPLGQILLCCGYITEQALAQALELQRDLKLALLHGIEARVWPIS